MNNNPFLTVLIIAHDRRNYLFDAIKSVLSQDFPKDKYEILVVKYEIENDREVNRKLEELNIRYIDTKEVSLGAKIVVGAEEAKGNVLSFLEDDDLFLDGKLARIYQVFNMNKKVGYYHNEMKYVNVNNKEVKRDNYYRKKIISKFNKYFYDDLIIRDLTFWNRIPILSLSFFGFNNSSISIRKDVIIEYNKVYKYSKSGHAIDFINFILSLEKGYLNAVDKKILTIYRVHSLSTSYKKFNNKREQFKYFAEVNELQLYNLELLRRYYDLKNTSDMLDSFMNFIKLLKFNNEEFSGTKANIKNRLSLVLSIINNSKDYLYNPRLVLDLVYLITPFVIRKPIYSILEKIYDNKEI